MSLPDVDLVVFDLAGTTVEDGGEVPAAFTAALRQFDIAVTADRLRAVRGASKRQAVLDLVPPGADRAARAERVYAAFCEDLAARYAAGGVRAIAGAIDAFAWLRDRGIRIALTTGFDRALTGLLLDALGWAGGTADAVICGDEVPQGRPAPYLIFRAMERTRTIDVRRVATVGDTALDLRAGWHAGVRWNVGVLSGAHDRRTLEAAPHTQLLPSVAQLPDLWPAG
ncbi:MAG TPA: phosphonatase-like hydrolase [Vicinamibacterales bacterium]|nr:phosphonatase-like hydrolase [Vicinamibacterales bacterium]